LGLFRGGSKSAFEVLSMKAKPERRRSRTSHCLYPHNETLGMKTKDRASKIVLSPIVGKNMKKQLSFTMLRCLEIAFLVNVFVFWACSIGYSAIGFDAVSEIGSPQRNAGASWSHTVGTGSNRIILVGVGGDDYNPQSSVTSITYGGQALTRSQRTPDPSGYMYSAWSEIWYQYDFSYFGRYTLGMVRRGYLIYRS
jgi:hypothetical protein